ncbi:TPA: helix-turn-helix domain-containing protein [Streptococcus suis]|nr:helix-turn-helix domain-containing protein [Streptococcus suis]HEO6364474.1 helix-turn-helix domain-containing protein [Streptococcus agalactiae]NQN59867.1 helix-turn-helix domain-containing protein [Streptococcus suis]NQO91585.1 helix-turn-helix domain-containing protein [Streptococcus suis]NQP02244.1 helix-turn-helix domain-containing protein [Streptococcus suis]
MMNREKFKAIRKQRKLSLKALGEVAGSATSISDFENGHTTLSNDVLFQLLGFMLVEINEFFEWKDFQDKDFYSLIKQLEEALNNKDIQVLSELKLYLSELSYQKGQYIYQIMSLVLEVLICELEQVTVNHNTIFQLTDYFFSLEYWTNLDIGLLGNLVPYFTTNALIVFTNTILEDTPQSLKNNLDRIKIDTVLNCLSVFLERKERDASQKLLTLLFCKKYPTYFSFEKLYLHELQAMFDYLWGDKEKAIKIHETILETVNIIFNSDTMKEWDYYFSKNTSKKA